MESGSRIWYGVKDERLAIEDGKRRKLSVARMEEERTLKTVR